jgi:hypothetical protein
MREVFRGWRRKVGAVTLVMACVFAVGWLRSGVNSERIVAHYGKHSYHFVASDQRCLKWIRSFDLPEENMKFPPPWYNNSDKVGKLKRGDLNPVFFGTDEKWRWQFRNCGFLFADGTSNGYRVAIWQLPYWSVTIPLTLLSLWLLLSTPLKSTQKKTQEPIPSDRQ